MYFVALQVENLKQIQLIKGQNIHILNFYTKANKVNLHVLYTDNLSVNLPLDNIEELNKFETFVGSEENLNGLVSFF